MTYMLTSFLLDLAVAGLLVITIGFCWRLSRRIRVLQDSKSELAQLIRKFDESTERATQSILELQASSKKAADTIAARIEKANFIADDLSYMIDKGSKLADQMESSLTAIRANNRSPVTPQPQAARPAPSAPAAPRPPVQQGSKTALSDKLSGVAGQTKAATTLESVLERISGKSPETTISTFNDNAKKPGATTVRIRSKAEQELFDALKGRG